MTTLPCPRCGGHPRSKTVYGIDVLQCGTLLCGAVVSNHGGTPALTKWNARAPAAGPDDCRHCGAPVKPFEFEFAQMKSYGFTCTSCGCSTGGRTPELALQKHLRGLNDANS